MKNERSNSVHFASPFAAVGFWRNPFGELAPHERVELAVVNTTPWLAYLDPATTPKDARRALQFIGDCGFGKTTHLLVLESQLENARRVYFPEQGPRPKLPVGVRVLIVDEAQRMGWIRRLQMLRHPGPLVLGTHVDLSRQLQHSGFEVWTVDVAQSQSATWIADALNRRMEASMICMELATACCIDELLAGQLSQRFRGNMREIERFLFDAFQTFVRERSVWPPVA